MKKDSDNLLSGAFENAGFAILIFGPDGAVIQANTKAGEMLGFSAEDVIGDKFSDMVDDPDDILWNELTDNCTTEPYSIDTVVRLTAGRKIAVRMRAVCDSDKIYLYLSDNSELEWSRQELLLTNDQLERNQKLAREKENYLRAIFRATGTGIALLNLNGTAIECNNFYQTLAGRPADQLRAMPFSTFVHPDDRKGSQAIFNDLAVGKCSHYQLEQRQVHADGTYVWVKVAASLIRSDAGVPDYALFIVEDITEQKEAELSFRQSELKYRTLFQSMLDGFCCHRVIRDEEGNVVDYEFTEINDSFAEILGLRRKDIIGEKLTTVLSKSAFTLEWSKLYRRVDECKIHIRHDIFAYEIEKWFSVLAYSPEPEYFVTFLEDITERRQIEEEIRVFATELECSNRELEHFVNRASGELTDRIELISQGIDRIDYSCNDMCKEGKDTLGGIRLHCNSLQGMLDGLLVYSRMVYRGNPFEAVDMNLAVEDAEKIFAASIARGGIKLEKTLLPTIEADQQQIYLMVEKIIDWLQLFKVEDELIVKISSIQSGKNWDISISGSKIDIPQEISKIIFDVFRSFEYKGKTYSTGIHLPLCKKIMERHSGQIALSTHEEDKCIFHLTFPIPTID